MYDFVNSHGVDVIIAYMIFAAIVGSAPPLPADASYAARWAFGAMHALSMNFRSAAKLFKLDVPDTSDQDKK